MHNLDAFMNRLRKNLKPRRRWAEQVPTNAYRLYDADIPEFRHIVDIYGEYAVVYDRGGGPRGVEVSEQDLAAAVASALGMDESRVYIKGRRRMQGTDQYKKLATSGELLKVQEQTSTYLVNLSDYLDTGLFLDHRPLRSELRKMQPGQSLLNLFCYTGSVSVAAAQAGAKTESVDLSQTYLDWAQDNFRANGLELSSHNFVRADAREYLAEPASERFDVIFLDPPTFSNSKRMRGFLDTQRDHARLIDLAMGKLTEGGRLYFSTNKRVFILDPHLAKRYSVADITHATIPEDFRDRDIHKAFLLQHRN